MELERDQLYKKAGTNLSAIVQEKRQELVNSEARAEQKPKENCQSASTKHSTQQHLFPLAGESHSGLLKNSVVTSSKGKLQTRAGFRKAAEPFGPRNEAAKIKLIPGARGESREGKRNTSAARKFK